MSKPSVLSWIRRNEKICMVIFTLVIALSTTIYTVISLKQWSLLRESINQTNSLVKSSKLQADAAMVQASSARAMLEDSRKSNIENTYRAERITKANELLANTSELQAKSMQQSVAVGKVTASAAEKSARTAQDTLYIGVRPWVLVKTCKFDKLRTVGEGFIINIEFYNFGNSPAFNMTTVHTYGYFDSSASKPKSILVSEVSKGILGAKDSRHNVSNGKILTAEEFEIISNRKLRFYVWGVISYDDQFGKHYKTEYCMEEVPNTNRVIVCSDHNGAD